MATPVEIKEILLIHPSEPTPSHVLPLSALDSQLFLRFTIEYLLVYRYRPGLTRKLTSARIKDALARALVPYYPFAGRVRARPDGSGGLEVACRAQGAYFVEGTCNASVTEFDRAPRYSAQWRNLLSVQVSDVLCGFPPLVVQLTWLANGDAAIGVGINHCICDGIGSAEFLNSFADLASGRRRLADLRPKPVWDRHLLNPQYKVNNNGNRCLYSSNTSTNTNPHPEFNRVQDLSGFVSKFTQEPLSPTSVIFDRSSLSELQKLASLSSSRDTHNTNYNNNNNNYNNGGGIMGLSSSSSYTSFEVLSAHVWRSWARSLELSAGQTVRMIFSVNVRERMKPKLPEGYYGNGFVLGCAEASMRELSEKGLGHAAALVRKAKERVGDEYVRSVVDAVAGKTRACPETLVGVLIVSQWSRLGLERVDFGIGKPVHVGPICTDRYCLLLPVYDQSEAVKVVVAVPKSAAAKYEYLITSPCS